jgi:hypothetical protein
VLHSDDHPAYPRALRRLGAGRRFAHHVTPGTAPRTTRNPLFPANLLDLLIRHASANHKRETIAFSKRRQGAIDRLWLFAVWRNAIKSRSERRRDASPAERLGLLPRRLTVDDVLAARLFPSQIPLPPRWQTYYWRRTPTRRLASIATHAAAYAV